MIALFLKLTCFSYIWTFSDPVDLVLDTCVDPGLFSVGVCRSRHTHRRFSLLLSDGQFKQWYSRRMWKRLMWWLLMYLLPIGPSFSMFWEQSCLPVWCPLSKVLLWTWVVCRLLRDVGYDVGIRHRTKILTTTMMCARILLFHDVSCTFSLLLRLCWIINM
jgi:hypothetical protein